jgi:hypothetical protein
MKHRVFHPACFVSLIILLLSPPLAANDIEKLILQPALSLLGASYATGSMGPGSFDCSGFVNYLYKPYRSDLPRVSRDIAKIGEAVSRKELKPGDLLFFATGSAPGRVTHVAIYLGQDSLIHAISNGPDRGVTITPLSARYWNSRYHSSRRVLPERYYQEAPETVTDSKEDPVQAKEEKTFAKGLYQGKIRAGEPEGEGLFTLDNGDRYEGEFRDGFPEGVGRYTWANGDRYEGSFRAGTLSGEGTLRFNDGSRVKGLWREGVLRRIDERDRSGSALTLRTGDSFKTSWQKSDSPWDSFNGVVSGDYELWRAREEERFESWKKENSSW